MSKIIRIYTDGACSGNPGPGGWATVWCGGDKLKDHRGGEPNTTNNRMELLAVLEALRWICKQRKSKSTEYEIYSDSAYVVNAITKCWLQNWKLRGWKTSSGDPVKNKELWQQMDKVLTTARIQYQVSFHKVKGHAGDPMNEYADKIAKSEATKQQYEIRTNTNG